MTISLFFLLVVVVTVKATALSDDSRQNHSLGHDLARGLVFWRSCAAARAAAAFLQHVRNRRAAGGLSGH